MTAAIKVGQRRNDCTGLVYIHVGVYWYIYVRLHPYIFVIYIYRYMYIYMYVVLIHRFIGRVRAGLTSVSVMVRLSQIQGNTFKLVLSLV